jgi:hypothetical protein
MEVCIIKDTMGVARNNRLEFQRLHEHHPLYGEGSYVEHPLEGHL